MNPAAGLAVLSTCLGLLLALCGSLRAQGTPQPPGSMAYQGYLTGLDGVPLGSSAPKAHDIIFRIYDAETGGQLLWAEQQAATFDKGYFGVQLGEGIAVVGFTNPSSGLSALFADASGNNRWVETTVKGLRANGGDLTVAPRVRLASAPFAYLALAASSMVDANRNILLSASSSNLVASTTLTTPSISVPTATLGTLTISNSLNILGTGGGGGRLVRTREGALRVVAGRHRWTNGAPNNGAGAQFVLEPSPGYSISRTRAGEYKVTFDTAFNTVPSVVATAIIPGYGSTAISGAAQPQVIQSSDATVARKEFTVRLTAFSSYESRDIYHLVQGIQLDPASSPPVALMIFRTFGNFNGVDLVTSYFPTPVVIDWDLSFFATGN